MKVFPHTRGSYVTPNPIKRVEQETAVRCSFLSRRRVAHATKLDLRWKTMGRRVMGE